jgi:hypothetical protein
MSNSASLGDHREEVEMPKYASPRDMPRGEAMSKMAYLYRKIMKEAERHRRLPAGDMKTLAILARHFLQREERERMFSNIKEAGR